MSSQLGRFTLFHLRRLCVVAVRPNSFDFGAEIIQPPKLRSLSQTARIPLVEVSSFQQEGHGMRNDPLIEPQRLQQRFRWQIQRSNGFSRLAPHPFGR